MFLVSIIPVNYQIENISEADKSSVPIENKLYRHPLRLAVDFWDAD